MHMFIMAVLRIAKDQYNEVKTKLVCHIDALGSLRWGGADIANLRRSCADLRQVQPAHKLAFEKLVKLLDDEKVNKTACAVFCAFDDSANKLS